MTIFPSFNGFLGQFTFESHGLCPLGKTVASLVNTVLPLLTLKYPKFTAYTTILESCTVSWINSEFLSNNLCNKTRYTAQAVFAFVPILHAGKTTTLKPTLILHSLFSIFEKIGTLSSSFKEKNYWILANHAFQIAGNGTYIFSNPPNGKPNRKTLIPLICEGSSYLIQAGMAFAKARQQWNTQFNSEKAQLVLDLIIKTYMACARLYQAHDVSKKLPPLFI